MSSNPKIIVDEELIHSYSMVKNVSLEEARRKLEENFISEASVDLRQQMTTLMNAFRKMSPQLNGVVIRESDTALKINSLGNEINKLQHRLDAEREIFKQSIQILNGIVEEDKKTIARITALEAAQIPFYLKFWNGIKCLLKL